MLCFVLYRRAIIYRGSCQEGRTVRFHPIEEYVQVQVLNVSTGEYVGNVIENF